MYICVYIYIYMHIYIKYTALDDKYIIGMLYKLFVFIIFFLFSISVSS